MAADYTRAWLKQNGVVDISMANQCAVALEADLEDVSEIITGADEQEDQKPDKVTCIAQVMPIQALAAAVYDDDDDDDETTALVKDASWIDCIHTGI